MGKIKLVLYYLLVFTSPVLAIIKGSGIQTVDTGAGGQALKYQCGSSKSLTLLAYTRVGEYNTLMCYAPNMNGSSGSSNYLSISDCLYDQTVGPQIKQNIAAAEKSCWGQTVNPTDFAVFNNNHYLKAGVSGYGRESHYVRLKTPTKTYHCIGDPDGTIKYTQAFSPEYEPLHTVLGRNDTDGKNCAKALYLSSDE